MSPLISLVNDTPYLDIDFDSMVRHFISVFEADYRTLHQESGRLIELP
jgi:hypothetical protein